MQYYFEQCDQTLMKELKRTIQESLSEMIDGSSTIIRLLYFITNKSKGGHKQYKNLESNGKLQLWVSTFSNLVHKIDSHFSELISLLCSYIKVGSGIDIKKELEKESDDFSKAIDLICPIESQFDKQKFFITQICEQNGAIFMDDCISSDEDGMKKQGVISTNKRPDGKGVHIVSTSIANIQETEEIDKEIEPKEIFEINSYETGIEDGKKLL